MSNNKLIDWQDKLDLLFSAKQFPHPVASKLASLFACPHDVRARILQAEIELLKAAKMQRDAIESIEQWVRQQRDEEAAQ